MTGTSGRSSTLRAAAVAVVSVLVVVWLGLTSWSLLRFDLKPMVTHPWPSHESYDWTFVPEQSFWYWPGTTTKVIAESDTTEIVRRRWLFMNVAQTVVQKPLPNTVEVKAPLVPPDVARGPGYWVEVAITIPLAVAAAAVLVASILRLRPRDASERSENDARAEVEEGPA